MDGGNALSDAEMRLITLNGQTVMLEGDFENVNMTNEFLNEMLMVNNSKIDICGECNVQINENSCINCVKETNDETSKLEISIQGGINELETVQIGLEEAKTLGLYFYESKTVEEPNSWNYTLTENQDTVIKDEDKISGSSEEICKVKLHSVPILSVNSEPNSLISEGEMTKFHDNSQNPTENIPYSIESKLDKITKLDQEDNADSLPAIGHLEGFQIPTSEDGLLLPATVNAKMVDGTYQTITLVPQVVNGAVTYTVHFSNLSREMMDKNVDITNGEADTNLMCSNVDSVCKERINCELDSVDEFLSTVQPIKNNQSKKFLQNNPEKFIDNKRPTAAFINAEESLLKINKEHQINSAGNEMPVNYILQNQLPIDAKIDNLISENENVISQCKKVKYGKKFKSSDMELSTVGTIKANKSTITKSKKAKLKSKGVKLSNETDLKVSKMSLLKPNTDKLEPAKPINNTLMPHMNLNGRLEYPNLKALDETASVPYLKVKSAYATKQPYFNVLPYPKAKTIPVQKRILPLNCDLQQAKSLVSLQKFLETQKLQLKIQPLVPNGNKIINIKPKPTVNDEVKVSNTSNNSNNHVIGNNFKENQLTHEVIREGSVDINEKNDSVKLSYQDSLSVKDVLLSDGKLNSLKFLKQSNSDFNGDIEKETNSDCSNKLNGIFIKNNPEYFSQKVKDGKIDEHPLGSSENPIQLVQTGHTFHSRQPLSESQLKQIASILQKQKFDSPNIKKNSIFDPKTNTRIVYRVVYPEDVELKDAEKSSAEGVIKRKRGRSKIKSTTEEDIQKKPSPLPRGPGRPKKTPTSFVEEDAPEEEAEDTTPKKKIPRTRSGRLSRPPRYMVKDYKRLHSTEISEKTFNSNFDSEDVYPDYTNVKKNSMERTESTPEIDLESNLLPGLRPQQRSKRNFKPEYRCPTCQKIYLGHTRMMWHLNKFPDHCNVEKYKENYYRKRTETKVRRAARRLNMCDLTKKVKQVLNSMSKEELISFCGPLLADAISTWDFLLLRVNVLKESRKDEAGALLHELVLLLEKLTKIAEDIFLPVFSKETEKDEDCIEIDRMEVAIALGLPVGFYKVNNDNLNLLRLPVKSCTPEIKEMIQESDESRKTEPTDLYSNSKSKDEFFREKADLWGNDKGGKKLEDNSFWLESKTEDGDAWQEPEEPVKKLSMKFEPNLSSKLLESSNDSIDDGKYEEPVQLIDIDSNSKDVEQSNSSTNMDASSDVDLIKDHGKSPEMVEENGSEEKPSLWNENSTGKVSEELWHENSERDKWNGSSDIHQPKTSSELWTNETSEITPESEKPTPHLWNENSTLTSNEKVDETNSEFLDSLLAVPNSNEFLGAESGSFLSENIVLMNEKNESIKTSEGVINEEKKENWRSDGHSNYIRVWDTCKNNGWQKEENMLSSGLQDRLPGVRTSGRLTSTPETNGSISFSIPNRRNSISDFSNINLEPTNLDMVLPSAKTLIKDCLKDGEGKFDIEGSDNFKVKTWSNDATKTDFTSQSVNSEDLMNMALESLTSQHDVINVPSTSFDSAMGILNQNQETGNLNLFTTSETDGLDFNLPLPDHLLRSNFGTTCAPTFQASEPPPFLPTANNIFGTTCTNSIKFDQFDTNFTNKRSKSLDDVIEFFDAKASFNGFEGNSETGNMNNFSFESTPGNGGGFPLSGPIEASQGKKKQRVKKRVQKSVLKPGKKGKCKKSVDYPKTTNTIESIINEALSYDGGSSSAKPLQLEDSSPNHNSTISNATKNYSLPIISGSLDEVENLDFLNQD